MFIDLYNLGVEGYFIRSILSEKNNLYGSLGYTNITVFFITTSFITSFFFIRNFSSKWNKIFLFVLLIINIVILILSNSRGGILSAIISISFLLIVIRKHLFIKVLTISFIVLLSGIFIFTNTKDVVDNYLRWHTVDDRLVYWQAGIEAVKENPIFGLGPKQFEHYFFSNAPSKTFNYLKITGHTGTPHPHNFFLFYTAENGILGLIISLSFFVVFFYFAIKTMKLTKSRNNDYFIISTTITGIGIALFFRSFIEITGYLTYGYITIDLPFWLMFGVLIFIFQKFKVDEDK